MSGSAGKKDDKKDDIRNTKEFQASAKLVESGLRFKLAGGGLRGGIEAVPALLKFIVLMGKLSSGSGKGNVEIDAKVLKLQKQAAKQFTLAFNAQQAEIKKAALKPMKPMKPMKITEKNASKSFALLKKASVDYVKLIKKTHKINSNTE